MSSEEEDTKHRKHRAVAEESDDEDDSGTSGSEDESDGSDSSEEEEEQQPRQQQAKPAAKAAAPAPAAAKSTPKKEDSDSETDGNEGSEDESEEEDQVDKSAPANKANVVVGAQPSNAPVAQTKPEESDGTDGSDDGEESEEEEEEEKQQHPAETAVKPAAAAAASDDEDEDGSGSGSDDDEDEEDAPKQQQQPVAHASHDKKKEEESESGSDGEGDDDSEGEEEEEGGGGDLQQVHRSVTAAEAAKQESDSDEDGDDDDGGDDDDDGEDGEDEDDVDEDDEDERPTRPAGTADGTFLTTPTNIEGDRPVEELAFMVKCLDTGGAVRVEELENELTRAQDKALWKQQQEKILSDTQNRRKTLIQQASEILVKDLDTGEYVPVEELEKKISLCSPDKGLSSIPRAPNGEEAKLAGIGIVLWRAPAGPTFVKRLVSGGAGQKCGRLAVGDCLIEIDDVYVFCRPMTELLQLIPRRAGTVITLAVLRIDTNDIKVGRTTRGQMMRVSMRRTPIATKADHRGVITIIRKQLDGLGVWKARSFKPRWCEIEASIMRVHLTNSELSAVKYVIDLDVCRAVSKPSDFLFKVPENCFGVLEAATANSGDQAWGHFISGDAHSVSLWQAAMTRVMMNTYILRDVARHITAQTNPRIFPTVTKQDESSLPPIQPPRDKDAIYRCPGLPPQEDSYQEQRAQFMQHQQYLKQMQQEAILRQLGLSREQLQALYELAPAALHQLHQQKRINTTQLQYTLQLQQHLPPPHLRKQIEAQQRQQQQQAAAQQQLNPTPSAAPGSPTNETPRSHASHDENEVPFTEEALLAMSPADLTMLQAQGKLSAQQVQYVLQQQQMAHTRRSSAPSHADDDDDDVHPGAVHVVVWLRESSAAKNGLKPEIVDATAGPPSRVVVPVEKNGQPGALVEDGVYEVGGQTVVCKLAWPTRVTDDQRELLYRALKRYVRRHHSLPPTAEELDGLHDETLDRE